MSNGRTRTWKKISKERLAQRKEARSTQRPPIHQKRNTISSPTTESKWARFSAAFPLPSMPAMFAAVVRKIFNITCLLLGLVCGPVQFTWSLGRSITNSVRGYLSRAIEGSAPSYCDQDESTDLRTQQDGYAQCEWNEVSVLILVLLPTTMHFQFFCGGVLTLHSTIHGIGFLLPPL